MEENKQSEPRRTNRTPRSRREELRGPGPGKRPEGSDENHNINTAPGTAPGAGLQSLHLSRERSLKSISNWWKNSLENGPSPPGCGEGGGGGWGEQHSPRHHHSHSDSGISSMSGRSSCMSPMSELSSSSGSSRTSLRSSSIVSGSNILLEEEGETEVEYVDLCRELLLFAPSDSRIVGLIREYSSLVRRELSSQSVLLFQEPHLPPGCRSTSLRDPWSSRSWPPGRTQTEKLLNDPGPPTLKNLGRTC